MQRHEGFVRRIVHRDQENDYTVLLLDEDGTVVRVCGYLPGVFKGSRLSVSGEYKSSSRNGFYFSPSEWTTELPIRQYDMIDFMFDLVSDEYLTYDEPDNPFGGSVTEDEIKHVLSLIVRKYHDRFYGIVHDEPEQIRIIHPDLDMGGRFSKIPLLLNMEIADIQSRLSVASALVEVDADLVQYTSRMIRGINERVNLREEGDTLHYLYNNPYVFCNLLEDDGFEFPDADKIAKHFDLPMDSYIRCRAGVQYGYKKQILSEGHVYAYPEQLMRVAMDVLKLDETTLCRHIERMISSGILTRDLFVEEGIYLREYYLMECSIAEKLAEMNIRNQGNDEIHPNYDSIYRSLGFELDDQQKDAISTAINSPITIITGGPGTGKTTIIRGLVAALQEEGITSISLAAPTGKASLRMEEATGIKAQTIHRLLNITPKSTRDEVREINEDVVIIDEFSMVDIALMDKLVHALAMHVKLVFVGDVDQLPSVGPGYVLHDLIESDQFSVVRLTQVHRQAENSSIVRNARRVLNGEMIEVDFTEDTDLIFEQSESRPEMEEKICRIVASIVASESECIENIQVLSPVKEGLAGIKSLNPRLQALLNQADDSFETFNNEIFKTNDRIMLTKNDYSINVFNGEICKRCFVDQHDDPDPSVLYVMFDGMRNASYLEHERKTKWLTLAYAITVHKSQGSEYKYVVMPIFNSRNLYRNLIYTAMTRAKGRLFLVGSRNALKAGIDDVRPVERNTKLRERIASLEG